MRKKFSGMLVVMLMLVLMAVSAVVVSPMSVPVGVGDVEGESGSFVAQSGVDWWPMFRHDPSHSGYSTSTAPNTNNTIWSYTTGSYVGSSPAVADGRVYVGSYDGKVYCLDASSGAFIWSYTTGSSVVSSPAVADGKVYVGSYDTKVYCLDASSGAFIWSYTTGNWVWSSPAVADGRVYVGSLDYKVYCFGPPLLVHDVAVTNVTPSKTVVGQGYSMSINVTVENQGTFPETFNVTTYYNGTIPNGDFEKDPTGTSFNDITNWNHSSHDDYGATYDENLEIVDDYYFSGNKSLYSYIRSNTGTPLHDSRVRQYLWTENPVSTTSDYISLWIGGDGYTTSSRYEWYIDLILTDGTNTQSWLLRRDNWEPIHYDYYNATETGADGRTWKRYTRRIPDNIDRTNLTTKIHHLQCSWDSSSTTSWYRLDNIYFSDSEGNPLADIETKTVTNLLPGEETTLTFTWNTTGVAKGNYTITAYANPVPGETDTADNTLTDGWVVVTIPADANGDGEVDTIDLSMLGRAWDTSEAEPHNELLGTDYNSACDFNCDGKILTRDLGIMGIYWL